MRRLRFPALSSLPPALVAAVLLAAGCAALRPAAVESPAAGKAESPHAMGRIPEEIEITLSLRPGQSWTTRFVSTSEMRRTLTMGDGMVSARTRTVGLELVATQSVREMSGDVARIEVRESSARILQEGRFIDAPFRQFGPPNPVFFTLDTATGKADFAEMEKAYADWMTGVKEGPAGDILGKTFRLDSYVSQLKELYGKPFTRFAGKTFSKEQKDSGEREFVLPFLGPGVELGPVPVETRSWYQGFDVTGGVHYLKVAGKYEGSKEWSPGELSDRLADFDAPAPREFRSSGGMRGRFESTVDVLSGREIRSTSQLDYTSSAAFGGSTLAEEITGKSLIEPAD